jgi:phage terminase large subunit
LVSVLVQDSVYNEAYFPWLRDGARTQVFFGGSSSGKSVFVAQRLVEDLLRGGRNYLVCRQVARTLKTSVFAQVERVIAEWGVGVLFKVNRSDFMVTCQNGYQAVFVGLDDTEKVKSIVPLKGAWTDVWVEEATETDRHTVKQLYRRQRGGDEGVPKRMVLTFNPIVRTHWIFEEYFAPVGWSDNQRRYRSGDLLLLKTTYRDNRFLTEDDRADLEGERDEYFRAVYTEGKWGVLGHVVFKNWEVADLSGMRNEFVNRRHGLDFGFSEDPAAMPCTHYDAKRGVVYVYDELYERGLTNDLLAVEIRRLVGSDYVWADSAEPKSIAELQGYGVQVQPVRKGKDSVLFGIQWLQRQKLVVDRRCVGLQNELRQYQWKRDKDGRAMRQPIDRFNHAVDGLRYAYEQVLMGGYDVF